MESNPFSRVNPGECNAGPKGLTMHGPWALSGNDAATIQQHARETSNLLKYPPISVLKPINIKQARAPAIQPAQYLQPMWHRLIKVSNGTHKHCIMGNLPVMQHCYLSQNPWGPPGRGFHPASIAQCYCPAENNPKGNVGG